MTLYTCFLRLNLRRKNFKQKKASFSSNFELQNYLKNLKIIIYDSYYNKIYSMRLRGCSFMRHLALEKNDTTLMLIKTIKKSENFL